MSNADTPFPPFPMWKLLLPLPLPHPLPIPLPPLPLPPLPLPPLPPVGCEYCPPPSDVHVAVVCPNPLHVGHLLPLLGVPVGAGHRREGWLKPSQFQHCMGPLPPPLPKASRAPPSQGPHWPIQASPPSDHGSAEPAQGSIAAACCWARGSSSGPGAAWPASAPTSILVDLAF